jgi:hypothetical protein
VLEKDLFLDPVLSIEGRILGEDSQPRTGTVHAVPAGSETMMAETAFGIEAMAFARKEGLFCIKRLPPGLYDLYVSPHPDPVYGKFISHSSYSYHCFTNIEAGAKGLDLVLPETEKVKVTIHIQAEGEVKKLNVLHARFLPRQKMDPDSKVPPTTQTIHSLLDWPEKAMLDFTGSGSKKDALGYFRYSCYGTREVEGHVMPPMAEGWYIIGVQAYDPQNNPYFPMATGLVYLEPGSYSLLFKLRPTAIVRGAIHKMAGQKDLYLSLRDLSGAPLPLRKNRVRMDRSIPIAPDGSFVLDHVPLGRFVLWIGTKEDLEKGEALVKKEIEIKAGKNPFLKIKVP